jgi:hypothetical protein
MADEATRTQLTTDAANSHVVRWRASVPNTGAATFWATSAAQELGYRLSDAEHGLGEGAQRVFPDLAPGSFDKLTKEASRVANRLIDKHVTTDDKLTFYSQRHTFKDMARKAGVIDSVADKICGHAPATVGGRYGDGADVETMYAAMMTIDLTMIDTKSVVRAWSVVNWNNVAARLVRLGMENAQHAAERRAARAATRSCAAL